MAKQDGILQIKGTLDNLTFYKSEDGYLVKRKSGVSKNRIKRASTFVRTRENGQEFKECAVSAGMLRKAVGLFVLKAKDRRLSSRMVALFSQIKTKDSTSVRGERTIAKGLLATEGKELLKGFDFNARAPLASVLSSPIGLVSATGVVSITDLIPAEQLRIPMGATHFSLQCAYLNLDFATGLYEVCYSPTSVFVIDDTVVHPTLTPVSVPVGVGVKLYFFLIVFSQEVNGTHYALHNGAHNVLHLLAVL